MAKNAVPWWIAPVAVGALTLRVGVWLARAAGVENPFVAAAFAFALAAAVTWAAIRTIRTPR